MIAHQHKAATIIQAHFRSYIQKKHFSLLKQHTTIIQYYWRATLLARQCRTQYLDYRQAVIVIQSHLRRYKVQKLLVYQNMAAIKIQSVYHMYLQRKRYLNMKQSVRIIEDHWMATLLARYERSRYIEQKRSVIVIQSYFRRWCVQKMISRQNKAATMIQCVYRCYTQRTKYTTMKIAVNVLQIYWRAALLGNQCRREYLDKKRAVIILQAHTRRLKVERMIACQHRAATMVQAMFKGYTQRGRYLLLKQSVNVIECYWKATLQSRQCRTLYLSYKEAAILLQSHIRRMLVQKDIACQHKAATSIQSVFRCYAQKQYYSLLKRNVKIIQYHWRATLLARQQRRDYLEYRRTVIMIQSYVRKHAVQRMIKCQHQAATIIQASYRCHTQRNIYLQSKHSANIIACHWRTTLLARQHRNAYLTLRKAIITLQSHYRRWVVQTRIAREHAAVTIIQAELKQFIQRRKYLTLKHSVRVIECYWSAVLEGRQCRIMYRRQCNVIIRLQAHVRGRNVRTMIAHQHICATKIQCAFRCHVQRKKYLALKASVNTITYFLKATLLARHCREEYLLLRQAAIVCQSHIRMVQVQRIINQWNSCAIIIQSLYRSYTQRKRYLELQHAVNVIQVQWRATLLGRQHREMYLQQKRAAIVIQANFRRRQVQKMIAHQHKAAIMIQATFRKYSNRRHYISLKHSVSIISNYWKATLIAQQYRNNYVTLRQATITVQSQIRRRQVQQQIIHQHRSATIIQAMYRCYYQRNRYMTTRHNVCVIQCHWRATLASKRVRTVYLKTIKAVITIQSHIRRRQVQQQIIYQHRAASKIQSMYKCYRERRNYLILVRSVNILQCYWRATLLARQYRTDYNRQKTAVILLQANVRRMQVQKILTTQHSAATVIQSMYKCHLQRSWYLRLKSVVIMIQRLKRANDVVRRLKEAKTLREMNNAAIVIQRYWRRYHEVHYYERKINKCATLIQCTWRGYRVRRRIRSKAINEARRRIQVANRSAKESTKLINKLPSMLDTLLRSKYLSTVGDILKSFELITSVSERCSSTIVNGNALPVLYNFIGTSNRSRPTLEVVKICLLILNNIAKWKATQLSVLSCNEDVICLVDFMQKVYITHPDIMLTATTLLLHSYKHSHPEIVYSDVCCRKISSMKSVLTRKIKMSTGQQRPSNNNKDYHQLCLQYLNEIIIL